MSITVIVAVAVAVIGTVLTLMVVRSKKHAAPVEGSGKSIGDERLMSGTILNTIEDGVILIDAQRNIQLFNRGASEITGWPADEAMRLNCTAVLRLINSKGERYSDAEHPCNLVFAQAMTIRDNSTAVITHSEKQVAIDLNVTPLVDSNKNVYGAVAIFRDVSKMRAEEQQRAEFISTASHEMRTPVAAIEGYLSLALNDKVATIDARARDFLEKAHASTQHLGKLFQDLLTSAKAEDGRLSNHPGVIELSGFLQQLTEDLRFAAVKKGLLTEFLLGSSNLIDASGGEPTGKVIKPLYYVWADQDRIREVITNLFDNAVKYTEQGKITFGLTGNMQIVQFYVRDSGLGISREDVPHLFQKFYRVDSSATRTVGGTGLGLFICRKIIELYGGHIWVDSELGKGSTFYINLPRLTNAHAGELQSPAAASQLASRTPTTNNM